MQFVKNAVETKSWDDALTRARTLVKICPNSPKLNYYISLALAGKDDKIKSLQYIQKASDNTFTIATPPESAKLIWYARHDAEFPERTESAIAELTQDNKSKTEALIAAQQDLHEDHAIGLWTGVGLGAAGLVLIATGTTLALWDDQHYTPTGRGGLYFTTDSDNKFNIDNEDEDYYSTYTYKENPKYIWGISLLSIGAAFVISGTILSAVFGYKYSRSKQAVDYTLNISSNHLTFNLSF
ncbi:MAG: hypothetical protein IJU23_09450 [Proteobacteria bacterium]|nr:hypothetical protein [Pseudomonadota bacterium]